MRIPQIGAVWLAFCLLVACAPASARPCDEFFARLPNVSWALCNAAQLQASDANSVKGRTIYTSTISPAQASARVLVIGGIHGDELSSASMALHWIRYAQQSPNNVQWKFIPALNPDGLFSQPAKRVNANGVDLNRNFPTSDWDKNALSYWETKTRKDPRRWPGKQALSEPESQFLFEEIQRFKPNLIVSIHAPYGVLDFDGPAEPPRQLGRLILNPVGIFPGSLGNYGGLHKGMPVVTIELPSATLTPRNVEMERMWRDLHQWMGGALAHNN